MKKMTKFAKLFKRLKYFIKGTEPIEHEGKFITLEELKAHFVKMDAKKNLRNWLNNKFPKGYAGYNVYYLLLHPWEIIEEWIRQVKWAWQRVFRGWDDQATFSSDYYFSKQIYEIISDVKKHKDCVPMEVLRKYPTHGENYEYSDEDFASAIKDWNEILDTIIIGFKDYYDDLTSGYSLSPDKGESFNKAFDLFREYFGNLWT